MTLTDLFEISVGNLWRMKLRSFLTLSGVVIAIGAFVAMVSFGAGAQEQISTEYQKLGLFSTMQVYPADDDELPDSVEAGTLDSTAVEALSRIPGVNLAYPYSSFTVYCDIDTMSFQTDAQALPPAAFETKLFQQTVAGRVFEGSGEGEVIVTERLMEDREFGPADSVVGRQLIVSVKSSSLDSAIAGVLGSGTERVEHIFDEFSIDSVNEEWGRRLVREELGNAAQAFLVGYMNHPETTSDTLIIVGVIESPRGGRIRSKPVILSSSTARRFAAARTSPEPTELLSMLQNGELPQFGGPDTSSTNYPSVTLNLGIGVDYKTVKDSVIALGFDAYSFLEQFQEIQKFFLYFNAALGVLGLIALATASLGIVNTMVMSIIERRREIGILKSLGADDWDIRIQFLVESGVIGTVGSVLGILLGWIVTRIISFGARMYMEKEGMTPVELFALPLWLIGIALAFGLVVSLAAGFYPARRAARVNPVEALRNE